MNRFFSLYCKALEALIAAGLALMVVLVFGNVVLRYAFDSSITVSEELSRWLFIWVTFLGAVVALREHGHLGTDMLTSRLSPAARKACAVVAHVLMMFVCVLLLMGAQEQARINWDVAAPSSGWSMGIFYASGVVFAISALAILGNDLLALLTGRAEVVALVAEEQA